MKISKSTQDKLGNILKVQGYSIRYEKGTFRSGYCIVKDKKTVLINKFFPIEGIINVLMEIIRDTEMDFELLEEEQIKWVEKIKNPTEVTEKE